MTFLPDDAVARLAGVVAGAEPPAIPGGRYAIVRELGRGAMGTVWLARDTPLERDVAIKVMNDARDAAAMAARLEREARIVARLDHPGVVPIHEIGTLEDGRVYYVMKRVEGIPLRPADATGAGGPDAVDAAHAVSRRAAALRTFLRLCEAVAHAHERGIVHCDLKPENVLTGDFGELYVMDWGIARVLGDAADEARERGRTLGTPGYMAPEQEATGRDGAGERGGSIDERTDVFALGVILAELSGGARDSRPLRAIVAKARARRPDDRYPTALTLAADVSRLLDREPVSAYRENAFERASRFLERNRFVVWLIAGYLVLRVVVFFVARR